MCVPPPRAGERVDAERMRIRFVLFIDKTVRNRNCVYEMENNNNLLLSQSIPFCCHQRISCVNIIRLFFLHFDTWHPWIWYSNHISSMWDTIRNSTHSTYTYKYSNRADELCTHHWTPCGDTLPNRKNHKWNFEINDAERTDSWGLEHSFLLLLVNLTISMPHGNARRMAHATTLNKKTKKHFTRRDAFSCFELTLQ